jgi:hypothetical protein
MDKNVQLKDSIRSIQDQKSTDAYTFRFDTNDAAMTYWEREGYRIAEFSPFIKDQLMNLNIYDTADHPLVPYASMTENKMLIDQIRMINHKWIVASFTDGSYWGEMLIAYDIDDKENLKFKVMESVLYQP